MSTPSHIEPHHEWTPADADWADWRLYEYNVAATGRSDWKGIGYVIRDEARQMIGLAYGYSWVEMAELKQLWVHENCRGQGHGRALLTAFIDEARQRRVRRIWVTSLEFQAPKMYEAFGFKRKAELDGWPEGYSNVILCKDIDEAYDAPSALK